MIVILDSMGHYEPGAVEVDQGEYERLREIERLFGYLDAGFAENKEFLQRIYDRASYPEKIVRYC